MIVRKMHSTDVEKFPFLFHTVYKDYSFYNVRTPQFYQHLLVKRPGVGEENILVAEENGELVGFAAMGIKDTGETTLISVYEVAAISKEGVCALLSRIEEIGREKKSAYIEMIVPPKIDLTELFVDLKFLKAIKLITMGYLVNAKNILSLFVDKALSEASFQKKVTTAFRVGEETVSLTLPEGVIGTAEKADVTIAASPAGFLALLLRKSSFWSLFLTRKVRVIPLRKLRVARHVIAYLARRVTLMTPHTELT